eukprot:COSAG01_NODE_8070_length_2932_cov_46.420402_2_plen_113_part_00
MYSRTIVRVRSTVYEYGVVMAYECTRTSTGRGESSETIETMRRFLRNSGNSRNRLNRLIVSEHDRKLGCPTIAIVRARREFRHRRCIITRVVYYARTFAPLTSYVTIRSRNV